MVNYDGFKLIKVEKKEQIVTISLDNPQYANALTWASNMEMKDVFTRLKNDGDCRAVIWRSDGEHFSTVLPGAPIHPVMKHPIHPLNGFELAGPDITQDLQHHMSFLQYLLDVPQPMIVLLHGLSTGFALNMALNCVFVIAAEDTVMNDQHVNKGMCCGDGGAIIWPLLMGPQKAKQYLFTGDNLSVQEAERFGMVNQIVPRDQLDQIGWDLAKRLTKLPTMAIRFTKRVVNRTIWNSMNYSWEFADALQILCNFTDDYAERQAAAKEGRPPEYKGR